jgi:hypothetical protein
MRAACRDDEELAVAVFEATDPELAAVRAANERKGWEGLVKWADARRRLQRAEVRAWELQMRLGI